MAFGKLFGKNKGERGDGPKDSNSKEYQHSQSDSNADSGFGEGSGSLSSASQRGDNFVRAENHLPGPDGRKNLAVNKTTGDVVDDDTGEVITTTVTTTTTTVTKTTGGKGTKVEVSGPTMAEAPGDHPVRDQTTTLTPTSHVQTTRTTPSPAPQSSTPQPPSQLPPQQSNMHPAYRAQQPMQQPMQSAPMNHPSPYPIPDRNPNRKSREYGDLNFSRPTRSTERLHPEEPIPSGQPLPSNRHSTFENIKNAAVAAHGIGETLRGTLNDTVDNRIHLSRNPEKIAAIQRTNQDTLSRGQQEMNRVSRVSERTETSSVAPSTWSQQVAEANNRFSPDDYDDRNRVSQTGSNLPASFSPESRGQAPYSPSNGGLNEKRSGGLRKLMKKSPS